MDEMEKYRAKIDRRYRHRRTGARYVDGGRRNVDYKSPPMFTWGVTVQLLTLLIGGACMLFLASCAYVKRTILGG